MPTCLLLPRQQGVAGWLLRNIGCLQCQRILQWIPSLCEHTFTRGCVPDSNTCRERWLQRFLITRHHRWDQKDPHIASDPTVLPSYRPAHCLLPPIRLPLLIHNLGLILLLLNMYAWSLLTRILLASLPGSRSSHLPSNTTAKSRTVPSGSALPFLWQF